MTEAAAGRTLHRQSHGRIDGGVAVAVGVLVLLSLAVSVLTGGAVEAVLGVFLGGALLALVWVVPLRWSTTLLLFLGLTMESPYEAFACYVFQTPLEPLGRLLLGNLNLTTHVSWMKVSGFDCLLVYLLVVHAVRRVRGSDIDTRGCTPMARPMLVAISISLASMVALWAWGLANGGDLTKSLLQILKLVETVILCLVLHSAYRGVADLRALGYGLVIAAVYRALWAVWIYRHVSIESGVLPTSTTHADSALFASALTLLAIEANERVRRSTHWSRVLAAAIILAGMVYNHRRLVWIAISGSLTIVLLVSPRTPLKRRLARLALVVLPLVGLYVAAGWDQRDSAVFKPVATLRSVVDSKSDGSTQWRDMENSSLVQNISDHPWFGTGFGHEYIEYWKLPSVSESYPLYRTIPHNSLLAYFVFAGPAGIAGIFAMLITAIFLAARSYRSAADPATRSAALLCIVLIFNFLNLMYGDIGVVYWIPVLTLAPAMMLAGKLAVATGAWPHRTTRSRLRSLALAQRRREVVPAPEPEPGWSAR